MVMTVSPPSDDSGSGGSSSSFPVRQTRKKLVPFRRSPIANGPGPSASARPGPSKNGHNGILDEDEDLFSQSQSEPLAAPDEVLSDITNSQESGGSNNGSSATPHVKRKELELKEKNFRRRSLHRLSFSAHGQGNGARGSPALSGSSGTSTPSSETSGRAPVSREFLSQIYAGCMELFHTKKITTENAFSLKLLECLDQIIKTKTLDTSNMQMVGTTLEVGAKIFTCRVEWTYEFVLALAKTLGLQGRALEKLQAAAEELDAAGGAGDEAGGPDDTRTGEGAAAERRKRQRKKKRMLHTQPLEKLRMTFPDYTESYENRQDRVKSVYSKFLQDREYFDMNELTLNGSDVGEAEKFIPVLERPDPIPDTPIRLSKTLLSRDATQLKFIRFIQFKDDSEFNKNVHDLWGRPKSGFGSVEEEKKALLEQMRLRREALQNIPPDDGAHVLGGQDPLENEYAFDPNIPMEIPPPDDGAMGSMMMDNDNDDNDHDGIQDFYQDMDNPTQTQASETGTAAARLAAGESIRFDVASMMNVSNFQDLQRYCQALREIQSSRLQENAYFKHNFARGVTRAAAPRAPRTKKVYTPIEFSSVKWKDQESRWKASGSDYKTQLTERETRKWQTQRNYPPFRYEVRNAETEDDDDFLDALESIHKPGFGKPPKDPDAENQDDDDENDKDFVHPFLKFFVAQYNILQLLEAAAASSRGTQQQSASAGGNSQDFLDASLHVDDLNGMGGGGEGEGDYNVDDLWADGLEDIRQEDGDFCPIPGDRGGEEFPEIGPTPSAGVDPLDSFMTFFPYSYPEERTDENPEFGEFSESGELGGIKFARQPKPINMKKVKDVIKRFLQLKLALDPETSAPTVDHETSIDFLTLVRYVYGAVEERQQKFLSFSIILAALLHVIVDLRLFASNEPGPGTRPMPTGYGSGTETLRIICHGKKWVHKDNIRMSEDDEMVSELSAPAPVAPIPQPAPSVPLDIVEEEGADAESGEVAESVSSMSIVEEEEDDDADEGIVGADVIANAMVHEEEEEVEDEDAMSTD